MSTVGAFPGIDLKRMTIRSQVNPLDKTTIVSILPKEINEVKHTIQPGRFIIPKGTYDNPSFLVVGPSSWWKETDEGQPFLEIPHSSITVAHSVVRDYCNGILACDMSEVRPGLFYMPGAPKQDTKTGEYDFESFKQTEEFKALIEQARVRQKNWYQALVKMGDVLWARTNGNPLSISDDMRMAARELTMNDKPWLKDFQSIQMVNCKSCGALRNPAYPVCQSCKAIDDPVKAKELGLTFAK